MRRKRKVAHHGATEDKKIQNQLKKLGLNQIPNVDEALFFMSTGDVIKTTKPNGII